MKAGEARIVTVSVLRKTFSLHALPESILNDMLMQHERKLCVLPN
jgi:hypothetical protein